MTSDPKTEINWNMKINSEWFNNENYNRWFTEWYHIKKWNGGWSDNENLIADDSLDLKRYS